MKERYSVGRSLEPEGTTGAHPIECVCKNGLSSLERAAKDTVLQGNPSSVKSKKERR